MTGVPSAHAVPLAQGQLYGPRFPAHLLFPSIEGAHPSSNSEATDPRPAASRPYWPSRGSLCTGQARQEAGAQGSAEPVLTPIGVCGKARGSAAAPPLAAMQDNYGLTFGNSTRKAYQKELERRHQTL